MAQVDTSIYSQIRPFTMSDPVEQAGKMYALQGAAMGLEKNRRAMAEDDDLKAAAVRANGDPERLATELMTRGHVGKALELRKGVREEQKQQLELKLKVAEGMGGDAIALDSLFGQSLQKHGGNAQAAMAEVMPVYQQVRQKWASVAPLPEAFDPIGNKAAIGAAKDAVRYLTSQMEKFGAATPAMNPATGQVELAQPSDKGGLRFTGAGPRPANEVINLGGTSQVINKDTVQPGQVFNRTVSPDAQLQASTTMRGQNMADARAAQSLAAGKVPTGYRMKPDGTLEAIPGGPAADGKLTEQQGNATMFGIRAVDTDRTLRQMEQEGFKPTGAGMAGDLMTAGRLGTNWMASAKGQQYINAGKNFVAAVLRKESGATITDSEWASGTQLYIPMPGDASAVLAQKKQNRRLAISGLKEVAGPGAKKIEAATPARPGATAGWGIEEITP